VNVLFGSRKGLTPRDDLLLRPGSLGGSVDVEQSWAFGTGLAIGNFGRGRCDDLAVGDPYQIFESDGQTYYSAGAISVFYGKRSGLREQKHVVRQDSPGVGGEPEWFDGFGWMLAAGNIGDTRFDELIVGSPEAPTGPSHSAGTLHVLYGSDMGLTGGPEFWQTDFGGPGGNESGDRFGGELAVGDLGRGRYEDIVVGTPFEYFGDEVQNASGLVYVIYGRSGVVKPTKFELLDSRGASRPTLGFGMATGVADMERGGPDELAVTAPYTSRGGMVSVFPTDRSGVVREPRRFGQSTPGIRGEPRPGDTWGEQLSLGDFDGSGLADLLVGNAGATVSGQPNAGSVHAIYANRRSIKAKGDRILDQDTRGMNGRAEPGDRFGAELIQG
jgi:hypothetical protein